MTPDALAALHARCFDTAPRSWNAAEFARLLAEPAVLLVTAEGGFALGRVAPPEAELVTLAVEGAWRRQGVARELMRRLEAAVTARGAVEMFLEVAESNEPARALYHRLGYSCVGRRKGYYAAGSDALVLKRELGRPGTEEP